jgi:predicted aspartyl protease
METFSVAVTLAHPAEPERSARVDLLVDTGATISFVPTEVLANLGIAPRGPEREFETASGTVIRRPLGVASLSVDGHETITPVVFGEPGDATVPGAVALESLGLIVDPIARRLIPRRFLALRINQGQPQKTMLW